MTPHEKHCLDNAAYFTTVRGMSPMSPAREKHRHLTLEQAKEYAQSWGDGRTMIYAVTGSGRDAHICNA